MWKTTEGSTGRLLQLCLGYFVTYVIYGVATKYFRDGRPGFPAMSEIEFTVYSSIGGTLVCLVTVLLLGWYRIDSVKRVQIGPWSVPGERRYVLPSGVCTAVVIVTTTLMYMLPITIMVAMVVMRGVVIVIGRAVDAIQIRQGILDKRVYWEENAGVLLAVGAVAVVLLDPSQTGDQLPLWRHELAMGTMAFYVTAYALRIYIMNYFKNTSPRGVSRDNRAFFGVEQLAASATLALVVAVVCVNPFGWHSSGRDAFARALATPPAGWPGSVLAGTAFGVGAFFSVFLFMFKGRTATFAGLVNRLTSLIAGTSATLIYWQGFDGKPVKPIDWGSLGLILAAVAVLTRAERRRTLELVARHELPPEAAPAGAVLPAPAGPR